ncbi:Catechol 2,3-dioxygenase [Zobellia uliginosa]|uniref:Catechol 2,3-dioxygenase n=1 Tax=Zobellia uliginosa TaxID=143224 RepID=A0ABY1KL27_9FLAO|nr:VOC family protein [Zobellia uliginosa]SIS46789.1 Catechol 2,3-dioxygenase [Zobellia uliginosa]
MKVRVLSIPVQNQDKALKFYTEILGFIKKLDIPLTEDNRWLTVVSKEQLDGPEVLLEPAPKDFEPAKIYQNALFNAGIPCVQFDVESVQAEYDRLTKLNVDFTVRPTDMGAARIAVFNDTCGNLIQIAQLI